MFTTEDLDAQHQILNDIADLLDDGILKTTLTTTLEGFTVKNLKKAHQMQESGKTIGKTVINFYDVPNTVNLYIYPSSRKKTVILRL